jgi:hypothetical protein
MDHGQAVNMTLYLVKPLLLENAAAAAKAARSGGKSVLPRIARRDAYGTHYEL